MIGDFTSGIKYCLKGFKLISTPGLRRFILAPFAINTIVFSGAIWIGKNEFNNLLAWLLPEANSWWMEIAQVVLWIFFILIVLIIIFFTFTLLANLLGSPFNGLLSEKVEALLTGMQVQGPAGVRGFLSTVWPSIRSELKKMVYFILLGGMIFLLMLIPGLNVVSPFVWAVFTSWMLALEYTAYPMENHTLFFSQTRKELKNHPSLSFGFGLAVMIASSIPLVNFFIMPAAVAGATAMWVERFNKNDL